jgi:hypothetical protein
MNKRTIWALAGLIGVAILAGLGFSVGFYSLNKANLNATTIPLVSLTSGIMGALYFFFLYALYARGLRLITYFSVGFVALALTLPLVHAMFFTGDQLDLIIAVFTYYAPGIFALAPFHQVEISDWFRIILTINISWIVWGLLGLGIGYLREWLLRTSRRGVLGLLIKSMGC